MRHIILIITTMYLLASCTMREASLSYNSTGDSLTLSVAVMPTADCLPVYYAERMGLFDSLGVNVRLITYLSQMDIDTALANGHAQLGHSNLARMEITRRKGIDTLNAVAELHERLFLITARTKRIKTLAQLKGRMVAIDRFDNSDYWSDRITELAGLELTDIYRPQVNDIQLRTAMLTSQLVDAALLPEPYATEARMDGHQLIYETPDSVAGFNCFATPQWVENDTLRKGQVRLFLDTYIRATKELNGNPNADTLRAILRTQYDLTDDIIDTLRLPKLRQPTPPSEANRQRAADWVAERLKSQR